MTTHYTNEGWTANDVDKARKDLLDSMDEVLMAELMTSGMTPDPRFVQATQEAGSIRVATMTTTGATDYSATNGWGAGSASLKWETYTLKHDRSNSFLIDSLQKTQTGSLASASLAAGEFLRLHMMPEIDASRIASVSTQAVADGHSDTETLTKSTVLTKITDAVKEVTVNTGYNRNCTIYANLEIQDLLRNSTEYTKVRDIQSGNESINTAVETINGNPIVWMPSDRMHSSITLGTGYAPAAGASNVNFAIAAPGAAQGIIAYSNMTLLPAGTHSRGDGDFYGYRIFHDTLMPKQKRVGLYVSLKTPQKYTLTYDANSATATGTMASEEYTPGTNATVKTSGFSLAGKVFDYWSVVDDGSEEDYHTGDKLKMNDNVTLFAQWKNA